MYPDPQTHLINNTNLGFSCAEILRNFIHFERLWMEVDLTCLNSVVASQNGPEFAANSTKTMWISVFVTLCVLSEVNVEGHRRILV